MVIKHMLQSFTLIYQFELCDLLSLFEIEFHLSLLHFI
jgi:hypothetical protein